MDFVGLRRVLQQLEQFGAHHHVAGRGRQVVADLEGAQTIALAHLAEAIQYRSSAMLK